MNTITKISPSKKTGIPSSIRALVLGIGLATASSSFAVTWQYLGSYDATKGTPNGMTNIKNEFPAGLVNRILARLPESGGGSKPALQLLADDFGANISLVKDATITVAFVAEGAGYKNSLGFFEVPHNDLPTVTSVVDKIIFPNFSGLTVNGGGHLNEGDAINIGNFTAGTVIGFTVVADGWDSTAKAVKTNQSTKRIFRTIKRLNPEPNNATNLNAHTVLLSSPGDGLLILGIEDLNRTNPLPGGNLDGQTFVSDEDFNDAIIAIKVTPFDAIDTGTMQTLAAGITGAIPSSALTPDGKKVNICHFPPGNPDNYQLIEISVNSLQTHIDHHDDVYAVKDATGVFICPPIPKPAVDTSSSSSGGTSSGSTSSGGTTPDGTSSGSTSSSSGSTSSGGNPPDGTSSSSGSTSSSSGGTTPDGTSSGSSGTSSGSTSSGSESGIDGAGYGNPSGSSSGSGSGSSSGANVKGRLNWKEINKP